MIDAVPLRFQIGARTLAAVPRRLHRVGLSLDGALSGKVPSLPPLAGADGYLVTSLPTELSVADAGLLGHLRQTYVRYWTDLTIGEAAWRAGLSGNARSALKRKAKKLAEAGRVEIRAHRAPAALDAFHHAARAVSAVTYQERLLGSGLPDTPEFIAAMHVAAAEDRVRAWLMFVDERPIAYLYCAAEGSALRYDHVGHDPAWGELSPGTVLHAHAFAELFAEARFARFDFTEGEGQHKRQFATGGVACADLLLLRATAVNRALLAALAGWDGAMTLGKRATRTPALKRIADRLRRA